MSAATDVPLTAAAVRDMPAGEETDALVAWRVMAQPWEGGNPIPNYDGRWPWPPPYSTDVEAAMSVIKKLISVGFSWSLKCQFRWQGRFAPGWLAECDNHDIGPAPGDRQASAWAETLPLAVCRAALLASTEAT